MYLTSKGLAQLDLWPSDNERALFLLRQVISALEELATDAEADPNGGEKASRLREAARSMGTVMRETGTEVVAKVISNVATGG